MTQVKKFRLAVVIGRFQIFHNGHKDLIDHALSIADRVLVIIGSAGEERSKRNPFDHWERAEMIRGVYGDRATVVIGSQPDSLGDNETWVFEVEELISCRANFLGATAEEIVLVGHKKDASSFYLDLFPHYAFEPYHARYSINSTDLREVFFGPSPDLAYIANFVPAPVLDWLTKRSPASQQVSATTEMLRAVYLRGWTDSDDGHFPPRDSWIDTQIAELLGTFHT